jgi:hypothetical protein
MRRIAVMTVALSLLFASILCWAAEPNTEQAKAIAEIKELGGKVTIDEKSPDKPVISVDLHDSQANDVGLKQLEGLTTLQELNLGYTIVTDAGLVHLKGLTNLKKLNLSHTHVNGPGLAAR